MLFAKDDGNQCQNNKQNTEYDRDPEQCLFNAAAGRENTTGIGAGQSTEANALVLKNYANDQCYRDYNQRDIKICRHV